MFVSCNKDDKKEDPPPSGNFDNGVFIINEGLFNTGTGTISFVKRGSTDVQQKVYQKANNEIPIGNIVQSMNIINGKAFIMVNNADKVEVANWNDFKKIKTLENIPYPAYIIQVDNNKAYISCWDNKLLIVSLENLEITGEIITGTGPTKMLKTGESIWVLNQGGLGLDSTISIIDNSTDQLVHTIPVFPRPTGIQKDKNGNIWVMCSGRGSWQGGDSKGHLLCIDPEDYSIIKDLKFPVSTKHPEKLIINSEGDILFYNYPDGIYKFDVSSGNLETEAFIAHTGFFYGLAYDETDNVIYSSDPLDYVQNGLVYRFDAISGELINSFNAGVIPREFYFSD
ncbi:MAG: DUF5074 domain-containing protein [Chlorobi bacterium]|nr:DUF5074 domain-containing protein [Chlorobiota bacterium]